MTQIDNQDVTNLEWIMKSEHGLFYEIAGRGWTLDLNGGFGVTAEKLFEIMLRGVVHDKD